MAPTRLGTLDHPERFDGARSVSVYENAGGGLFIKLDGLREKLHGSTRWTTTSGVQMRGRSVYTAPSRRARRASPAWHSDESMSESGEDAEADEEQRQIDLAIERSLQQDVGPPAPAAIDAGQQVADEAGDDANPAAAGDAAPASSGSRNCVICLEENSACMVCQPCFHMVSCQASACWRRLQGRPCPICRRIVTRCTRVYF